MFILHTEPKSLGRSHSLPHKYFNCLMLQWFRLIPTLHIFPEAELSLVEELVDAEHQNSKEFIENAQSEAKASNVEQENTEVKHFYNLLSLFDLARISP